MEKNLVTAQRIRSLRAKSGMVQKELAAAMNLKHSTLASYETGGREPSLHTITRFAEFFGVTTDYLLGFESQSEAGSKRSQLDSDLEEEVTRLSERDKAAILAFVRRLYPSSKTKRSHNQVAKCLGTVEELAGFFGQIPPETPCAEEELPPSLHREYVPCRRDECGWSEMYCHCPENCNDCPCDKCPDTPCKLIEGSEKNGE